MSNDEKMGLPDELPEGSVWYIGNGSEERRKAIEMVLVLIAWIITCVLFVYGSYLIWPPLAYLAASFIFFLISHSGLKLVSDEGDNE